MLSRSPEFFTPLPYSQKIQGVGRRKGSARAKSDNAGIIGQGVFSGFCGEIGVPAKTALRTRLVCPVGLLRNRIVPQKTDAEAWSRFPWGMFFHIKRIPIFKNVRVKNNVSGARPYFLAYSPTPLKDKASRNAGGWGSPSQGCLSLTEAAK